MLDRRQIMALALASTVLGCHAASREVPDGWSSAAPLAPAPDLDDAETTVEVELVAAPTRWEIAPGRALDGYAYNGRVPGPVIEARVGDTLVVHFRNDLPEATTIHWHGIRVPAAMDGGPHSQDPVAPGGTFEYRFTLLDEGTFWYHPHVAESTQMERGLYGAIVVRPREPEAALEVDSEAVLVLDDLTLGPDGELAPFGGLLEDHGGREGDVQLVNGVLTPTVPARSGERQLWRIVNAGSARFYRLRLPGHVFTIVATDGGRIAAPRSTEELFLVPGDRLEVLVDLAGAPGSTVTLSNEPYSRGHGSGVFVPMPVATLALSDDPALPTLAPATWSRTLERLDGTGLTPRELIFDEATDAATETVTFSINGESWPDVTHVESQVGELEVWELVNDSEMDHPFHLHGFFFQVLSRDGVEVTEPTWEDTIEMRGLERVQIAFRVDDRPGMWMFHCHILEHVEHGMMGVLDVVP